MNNIENQEVPFLGLEVMENGPENDLILRALGASTKYLNIKQFMDVTNFKRDPIMTDYFWQAMVKKQVPDVAHPKQVKHLILACLWS
jgi:hypothetical protein